MNFNILLRAFENIEYCSIEDIEDDAFVVRVTFGRFGTDFTSRYTRDDVSTCDLYGIVNSLRLDFDYITTASNDEGWYLAHYLSKYLEEHLVIFVDDLEDLVRECYSNAAEISDAFDDFTERLEQEIDWILADFE